MGSLEQTLKRDVVKYQTYQNLTVVQKAVDAEIMTQMAFQTAATDAIADIIAASADPLASLEISRLNLNASDSQYIAATASSFQFMQSSFVSAQTSQQTVVLNNITSLLSSANGTLVAQLSAALSSEISRTVSQQQSVTASITSVPLPAGSGVTDYAAWFALG